MRGGNLLDVGCGEDPFLEVQKKRGYNVYGTDVDKTAREHFKKLGIEVRIGNLQNVKWSKNFFDVITLWHTLEHDVKPQETLKECYKILKDSGTLIISVPNFNSLERKIFNEHWIYLSPPRHIFQFTPESLSKVLADVGFRVYKVKYPGFSPQLWARSFLVFLEERKLIKLNSISRIFLTLVLFPFVIPLNLVSTLLKTGSVLDVYAEKKTP
ncbi:class I SAM-dependent methyltransferase [Patescibacteria group bacterium]|nr:class I SAM-dependent methyltransferase [Patescibacteria group bacterium]